MSILKIVLACVLAGCLSGCFLAPAIDSFNQLGVTESDRVKLLPQQIKRFQDALYWSSPQEALTYAAAENRTEISQQLRNKKAEERIVESKIENVDFKDNAYSANVEVSVRYFVVPYYIVSRRLEDQGWRFSLTDGWKLVSLDVKPVS